MQSKGALDALVADRPAGFQNPYENMTNQFAPNLDNPYANLTCSY